MASSALDHALMTASQQKSLFAIEPSQSFCYTAEHVVEPAAYEGILAFHKYWGKKPIEPLAFIIERLTTRGDLVVDPFSGSGVTGFAATTLGRRYLGIDINPVAGRLSSLVQNPPSMNDVKAALATVRLAVREEIELSYVADEVNCPATLYLWEKDQMREVWVVSGRRRTTLKPTNADYEVFERYQPYEPKLRRPRFFKNSRINADPSLTWHDLFTGRALRNIELLLDAIRELPGDVRNALELCLTAALGQMSKMVFAITGRGKTSGSKSEKVEVGSWVIGFWRPPLHFEVNVWNCFERKVERLIGGLGQELARPTGGSMEDVLAHSADYSIITDDALRGLERIPDGSAQLILTDPPHSDRAPYLELSELWNAVLGANPQYSDEIIVSNARDRGKDLKDYNDRMKRLASLAIQKLHKQGCIAIQFNARGKLSWEFFRDFEGGVEGSGVSYRGSFPLSYSATSVVQDNRKGAMKTDCVLIFATASTRLDSFSTLPDWTTEYPTNLRDDDGTEF